MDANFIDRIDAAGAAVPIPDPEAALRQGEAMHRIMRPNIPGDYIAYLALMSGEGARLTQLFDGGEVRVIAVWRTFLTTYCGRRFELDDLVTAEGQRSKGYGATLVATLEAKARALSCDVLMLGSATWRKDAHRFYLRNRYVIDAFLFAKPLT